MERYFVGLLLSPVLCCLPCDAFAVEALEGASNIIAQVTAKADVAVTASPKDTAIRKMSEDLAAFVKQRDSMEPDRAASAWLDLFDRFWKMDVRDSSGTASDDVSSDAPTSIEHLFAEMPGPETWSTIQKLVIGRDISKGADGGQGLCASIVCCLPQRRYKGLRRSSWKIGQTFAGCRTVFTRVNCDVREGNKEGRGNHAVRGKS